MPVIDCFKKFNRADLSAKVGDRVASGMDEYQAAAMVLQEELMGLNDSLNEVKKQLSIPEATIEPIKEPEIAGKKEPSGAQMMAGTPTKPATNMVEVVNGFYSPIEKRIAEFKQEKASAQKWKDIVGKGDEATWTGVAGWLNGLPPQQQVSKADVADWMKDNRVEVREVVKGVYDDKTNFDRQISDLEADKYYLVEEIKRDINKKGSASEDKSDRLFSIQKQINDLKEKKYSNEQNASTKFSQYQLEGKKEDYKEVLVVMPSKQVMSFEEFAADHWGDISDLTENQKKLARQQYDDYYSKTNKAKVGFKSSHFDEPNILVHLRMNTRTAADGSKVLFLEEVQSDWGQEGKKEGFDNKDTQRKELEKRGVTFNANGTVSLKSQDEFYEQGETWELIKKYNDTYTNKAITPQAPFVTDTNAWTKLGLKVAMKEAVNQGAEKIAWTTGEQQNDRYDLSKSVNAIHIEERDGKYLLDVWDKSNNKYIDRRLVKDKNELAELVGKDMVDKFSAQRELGYKSDNFISEDQNGNAKMSFQGLDLKVGGKGMKGFYGSPAERAKAPQLNIEKVGDKFKVGSKEFKNEKEAQKYIDEYGYGIVGNMAKALTKQEVGTVIIENGKTSIDPINIDSIWVEDNGKLLTEKQKSDYQFNKGEFVFTIKDYVPYRLYDKGDIAEANDVYVLPKGSPQHAITLTPDLIASVNAGQPLFMAGAQLYKPTTPEQTETRKLLDAARSEYDAAKNAYDKKRKDLMKSYNQGVVDLFGQTPEERGGMQKLFDEKPQLSAAEKALQPLKTRMDKAASETNRLYSKYQGMEKEASKQMSLFMADAGLGGASSRFRPMETVTFGTSITGPNGNQLVSYTWKYEWQEVLNNEGEAVGRRFSDWNQAETSADTGRDIVHQFTVKKKDGTTVSVSSESVPVLLGYVDRAAMKSLPNLTNAVKTLAKQRMQLAILEAQTKEYNDARQKIADIPKPEIVEQAPQKGWWPGHIEDYNAGEGKMFAMGDASIFLNNEYNPTTKKKDIPPKLTKDIKDQLGTSWEIKRAKEIGLKQPQGNLYDLRNRVERQQRKVEEITGRVSISATQQPEAQPQATAAGQQMSLFMAAPPTNSKAFKEWFGDSKVVNSDGSPMVVYHGTGTEITTFDKKKAQDKEGRAAGVGYGKDKFYFTKAPETADAWAERSKMRGEWSGKPIRGNKYGSGENPQTMAVYVSIQNPISGNDYLARLDEKLEPYKTQYQYGRVPQSIRDNAIAALDKELKKEGIDGIYDEFNPQVAVFSPNQVKSATGNVGTYSKESDDIRFMIGGEKGAARMQNAEKILDDLKKAKAEEVKPSTLDPKEKAKRILLATGWQLGKDGKWKYEMPPGKLKDFNRLKEVSKNASFTGNTITLISYKVNDDGTYTVKLMNAEGTGPLDSLTAEYKSLRKNELIEFLGKDIATEILSGKGNSIAEAWEIFYNEPGTNALEIKGKFNFEPENGLFLSDVIDSPKLFEAYPKLNDVIVTFQDINSLGAWDGANIILPKSAVKRGQQNVFSTILHETQHAIQQYEGFAKGGNPDVISAIKIGEEKFKEIFPKLELEYNNREKRYQKEQQDYWNNRKPGDQRSPEFIAKIQKETSELARIGHMIKTYKKTGFIDELGRYELYRRLAGEAEARNVQTRMDYDDFERATTLLEETEDVSREDQIVLMEAMGVNFMAANNDFRDGHSAPGMTYENLQDALDNDVNFNLSEVARGYHNQPDDYFDTKVGARYYMYDNPEGRESLAAIGNIQRAIKAGKDRKILTAKAYRAIPKSVNVDRLIDNDWVSLSKKYAVHHGERRFGEKEYKIIEQEVPIRYLWWDGNDINEWGYDSTNDARFMVSAYHGSPYAFDKFKTEKIGTGEGNQAFGWGMYFTDLKSIAEKYASMRDASISNLSGSEKIKKVMIGDKPITDYTGIYYGQIIDIAILKDKQAALNFFEKQYNNWRDLSNDKDYQFKQYAIDAANELEPLINDLKNSEISFDSGRNLYRVSLHKGKTPDQYNWLEWDKLPTKKQVDTIVKGLNADEFYKKRIKEYAYDYLSIQNSVNNKSGEGLYKSLTAIVGGEKQASLFLLENGIDGIKYPAESIARGANSDNARGFNYVVFDENAVTIDEQVRFMASSPDISGQTGRFMAYSQNEKNEAYSSIEDIESKAPKEVINEYVKNLTKSVSIRNQFDFASKYYKTGKYVNGKEAVIRVSDHVHNPDNVSEDEYLISILVNPENMSNTSNEEYTQVSVELNKRNIDEALSVIDDTISDVGALNAPQPSFMASSPIYYHGRKGGNHSFDREPIFLTDNPEDAIFYAIERGMDDGPPSISANQVAIKNSASIDDVLKTAKEVGVKITETNDEWIAPEIANHSPYNGTNRIDLLYIPKVRNALIEKGFDSVKGLDDLGNQEIPVTVILENKNLKTIGTTNEVGYDKQGEIKNWAERLSAPSFMATSPKARYLADAMMKGTITPDKAKQMLIKQTGETEEGADKLIEEAFESLRNQPYEPEIAGAKPNTNTGRVAVAPITGVEPKKIWDIFIDVTDGTQTRAITSKPGRRKSAGAYHTASGIIKIKYTGDLDTLSHELGHALDDRHAILGSTITPALEKELMIFAASPAASKPPKGHPNKQLYMFGEGWAEFIRALVVNPDEAKRLAPELYKLYESKLTAQEKQAIKALSDDVRAFAGASGLDAILANVETEPREKPGMFPKPKPGSKFHFSWVDYVAAHLVNPLRAFDKAFGIAMGMKGLDEVLPEDDPRVLIRLLNGFDGKFGDMLINGLGDSKEQIVFDADGNPITMDWLYSDLDNSSPESLKREMDLTMGYMIAERTVELAKRFERDNILTGIGGGIISDMAAAKKALDHFNALDKTQQDRLKAAADKYRQYADTILQYAVAKGRISKEQYDQVKKDNIHYVALQRIMETEVGKEIEIYSKGGKSIASKTPIFQRIKGSANPIRYPYDSLLDNLYKVIRESDRNEILQAFVTMLQEPRGMYEGEVVRFMDIGVKVAEPSSETVTVFVDGKAQHWRFHPEIVKGLKNIDNELIRLPRWATAPASLLRFTITNSPIFAARNFTRDTPDRLIKSNENGPFGIQGLVDLFGKSDDWSRLARFGGLNAGHYIRDKEHYYELMKDAMKRLTRPNAKTTTIITDVTNLKNLWSKYEQALQKAETVNRVAEYRSAFRKAKKMGYDDYNASLYAAARARELIDFAIAGHTMKIINQVIPFTNAAVQGTRAAFNKFEANPAGFAARVLVQSIIPQMIIWLLAHQGGDDDDEAAREYENLPWYQRDMFSNVRIAPNTYLSIPKPFELALPAAAVDRQMSYWMYGNKKAMEGFGGSMAHTLLPVDETAFMGPYGAIVETMMNKDYFRKKYTIPPNEEKWHLSIRNTERASRMGKIMQNTFSAINKDSEVDARQIDFFLRRQFGYFGSYAMKLSSIGDEESRAKFNISDLGFFKQSPAGNSPIVQQVYKFAGQFRLEQDKGYKELKSIIEEYYEAQDNTEKETLAREITRLATDLLDDWKASGVDKEQIEKFKDKKEDKK